MRIKLGSGLIAINLLALASVVFTLFLPVDTLRVILGVILIIFAPGYALLVALFPRSWGLGGVERVALSFGLSIAVVPLIGFLFNYTPWGISLESILFGVITLIIVASIVAWLRRRGISNYERFNVNVKVTLQSWERGIWNRILVVTLAIVVMGSLGILGYFISVPQAGDTSTEFYILAEDGTTENYPSEIQLGETITLIATIVNHEGIEVSYRIEVLINDNMGQEVGPIPLINEQKWQQKVSLMPTQAGDGQKVVFILYMIDEVEPYLGPLYLWIDVK